MFLDVFSQINSLSVTLFLFLVNCDYSLSIILQVLQIFVMTELCLLEDINPVWWGCYSLY